MVGSRALGFAFGVGIAAVVSIGCLIPGLSAARAASGINGKVRDAASGQPLGGVCVGFVDTGNGILVHQVITALDGTFSYASAPGSYKLAFYAPSSHNDCSSTPLGQNPAPLWFHDVPLDPALPLTPSPVAATAVPDGTQGLDVCLAAQGVPATCAAEPPPGTVAGTVLTTGAAPVANACTFVFTAYALGQPAAAGITNTQGTYQIDALPGNADVIVGFAPPFSGPSGPCPGNGPPSVFPPGTLQPVWSGNVYLNLADPALRPDPYHAALAQGAHFVHTSTTSADACLTTAPAAQVPRPPCVAATPTASQSPPPPIAVSAVPLFTG